MKSQRVNHRLVTLARQSRRLTQKELSAKIGIEQGSLSKIEKGFNNISESTLSSLSEALDYPEDFFKKPIMLIQPRTPFHRSRKSLQMRERDQLEAIASIQTDALETLLQQAETNLNVPFIPVDDQENTPKTIAFKVRRHFGIEHGPIENLTEVLENNGIFVVRRDFGSNLVDGFTLVSKKGVPIIFVSSRIPGDRLRWTLAHELGHIVMHDVPYGECEDEANIFSSEFLMPESEIASSLEDLRIGDLPDLKKFWKTSMWSIVVWAHKIGAIMQNRYKYLCMKLTKAGYRKEEPKYLEIPVEIPSLLEELIQFHIKELGFSTEDLSKMLSLNLNDLEDWFAIKTSHNVIPFKANNKKAIV